MPNIGFRELAVLLAIALLIFGSKRLPDAARGIGRSFNAFKNGLKDVTAEKDEIQTEITAEPTKKHT
jgi:TatA/E family protein of Tat protein translocase